MFPDLLLERSHIENLADSMANIRLLSEEIPFDQLDKPVDNTLSERNVSVPV